MYDFDDFISPVVLSKYVNSDRMHSSIKASVNYYESHSKSRVEFKASFGKTVH